METISARQGWASNFNDFPLLIMWENYNNISSAKTCLLCYRLKWQLLRKLQWKTTHTKSPKYLLNHINIWYLLRIWKGRTWRSWMISQWKDAQQLWILFRSLCIWLELSIHFHTGSKREKASAYAANAAVNIVYTVYDPPHKQVNAGGIKCLWLCFRHLQYTIHRGLLSTGKRTWLSLDIPVLRKPHLIRSWGCEETDTVKKGLKNRPVNWLSGVTGFSVYQESTQGQVRSIYKPCQMTSQRWLNAKSGV